MHATSALNSMTEQTLGYDESDSGSYLRYTDNAKSANLVSLSVDFRNNAKFCGEMLCAINHLLAHQE